MKKKYVSPSIVVMHMQLCNMIAVSGKTTSNSMGFGGEVPPGISGEARAFNDDFEDFQNSWEDILLW